MKLVKKVEKFAKENLNELNFEHSKAVRKVAKKLAKKENANLEIVEISALLHDIAREKSEFSEHHIKGKEIARELLEKLNVEQTLIDSILHCIDSHMMKTDLPDGPRPQTIEAKVVFDADMVNLLSPFGIAKMIYMQAKNNRDFIESIEKARKQTETAYSEIQTETAKKMAEKYWRLNQKFFRLIL